MADGGAPQIIVAPARRRAARYRVADLFCGAGGTSTGILRAARAILAEQGLAPEEADRQVDLIAVNHWPTAIDTHRRNHPLHAARTHCADLESARPRELVPEGVLDLLCASPTCTYHSRARGGRPVYDQMRMDPWHVVRWCTELRVHRVLVENVPEFMDWGPCDLRTGRPIKRRKGEYFRAWCDALRAVGFRLEYRVLNCADYGDATTRQRFFLIGASDGKPLRWPEPMFSAAGGGDLLGQRRPWRPAAEIIDWSREGTSIFGRKKPLVPNTLRRILAGAQRYGWPQPYLDALQALLDGREPVLDIKFEDLTGYVASHARAGQVAPIHAGSLILATASGGAAREADQPIPTVTTGGNGARPHFVQAMVMGVGSHNAARGTDQPLPTITTGGGSAEKHPGNARPQLIEPLIIARTNVEQGRGARPAREPTPTATTRGAGYLAEPLLVSKHGGPGNTARPASQPMYAADTGGAGYVAEPLVVPLSNSSSAGVPRGADLPLRTITTAKGGDMALAKPLLAPYYGGGSGLTSQSTSEPVPSITTKARFGLAEPFLVPNFSEAGGQAPRTHSVGSPLPTVTASGHVQLAEPFVLPVTHHGDSRVHGIGEPLRTITGAHRGELGIAAPAASGYRIDILYRMLHWRELARASSFDDEGEVYDFAGTGTEITKQIGNAVPGRTAKALGMALLRDRA